MCNFSQRTETDLNAYFMKILACKEHKLYSSIFSLQVIFVHNLDVDNYYHSTLMRPFTCSCVCTCRNACHGPRGGQTAMFGGWFFSSSLFLMKSPLLFLLPCSSSAPSSLLDHICTAQYPASHVGCGKQAYGIRLVLQVLSPAVPSRWPHLSTLLVTKHVFPVEFPSPLFAIRVYSGNSTHRPRYLASSCRPSQYNKQMAPFLPHPLPAHNPGAGHRGIE